MRRIATDGFFRPFISSNVRAISNGIRPYGIHLNIIMRRRNVNGANRNDFNGASNSENSKQFQTSTILNTKLRKPWLWCMHNVKSLNVKITIFRGTKAK